jgi:hypothetical protein
MGIQCQPETDKNVAFDGNVEIADQLEKIRRIIEGKFLAAGDILIKSIDGTKSLIASLDNLVKTFDAKIVTATKADLTVAAAKLYMLPSSHAERVDSIGRLNHTRDELAWHTSNMHSSLAYMRAFTLNIKIVAGSLGEEFKDFDMFAQDMSACIAKGTDELKMLENELTTLQRDLNASSTQGDILGMQINALVPAVPDELTASTEVMSEHYQSIIETVEKVAVIARDIQQRVARILGALQIGDITRQRIEHLQECIIRQNADKTAIAPDLRERFVATCYALIAAHMSELTLDFDRESAEIERNMADMAKDADELLKLHGMAYDSKDGGFLHRLGQRIDAAVKLVGTINQADKAAAETGIATALATRKLNGRLEQIQTLKNDVQYMALNTTLKCCQIGEAGRPLSVIAIEIRDHSKQLEAAALSSLSTIDKLLQLTKSLAEPGNSVFSEDSKSVAAAKALDVAARRLREARDLTESNIAEIAEKGDEVLNMLNLSTERLRFSEEIGNTLKTISTKVDTLAAGAFTAADVIPPSMMPTIASFASNYTMQQERNTHNTFMQAYGIASEAQAAPASPADDEDMILF